MFLLNRYSKRWMYFLGLLVCILGYVGWSRLARYNSMKNKGVIIILNGPSCAGKSTIQKKIQDTFDKFFIRVGVDNLFDNPLPSALDRMVKVDLDKVDFKELFPEGITEEEISKITTVYEQRANESKVLIRAGISTEDKEGNPLLILKVGPAGRDVIYGMHKAIRGYADAGCNVVVDYILYEDVWLMDLVNELKNYIVYFVKVQIPLETLEAREVARATSPKGHARSHYSSVYGPNIYDLVVDSGKDSADVIVANIYNFVMSNQSPTAFKRLISFYKE